MIRGGFSSAWMVLGLAGVVSGAAFGGTVTYSKDVAPILNENCVSCHRPGQIAPMSLLTYEEVRP